jgi:serine/threonine protein kinase
MFTTGEQTMKNKQFDTDVWTLLSERYKDFERIGEGGTAVVYKAHDVRLLRTVAIKTMSISRMTPEMVLRFQHEARAASKLQHPNLITVLDFGLTDNSRPYLVMDFVEGKSLEDLLHERDFLSIPETVSIILEVCRGMAFAHKNGVVHRDLKPSNILLLDKPDTDARVKVVDFGIAKLSNPELSDSVSSSLVHDSTEEAAQKRVALERVKQGESKSRTGELMGSPFYMSPEQIRGEEVDERTDIYALGCIMFRALSGMAPFEGETHLETYSLHLNELPPLIVDPVLPAELHALIDQCLAKNPKDRPASMNAVADSLRQMFKTTPEATSRKTDDLDKRVARRSFYAIVAVGLVLVGLTVWANLRKPAETKTDATVAAADSEPKESSQWSLQKATNGAEHWQAVPYATDADVDYIVQAKVPNISLHRNQKITNDGLRKLIDAPVTDLDLSNTQFDDSAIPILARMTGLRCLNLEGTRINDKSLEGLAPLVNLERLDLDQLDTITDKGLDTIIKQWPNITYLNLAKTSVKEPGLLRLQELHNLRGLELAELKLTDSVMKTLIGLDNIWELNLNHSMFERKWVHEFPKMKGLRLLIMSRVPSLKPADYQVLGTELAKQNRKLQCFDSLNTRLTEVTPIIDMMGEIDGGSLK